MTVFSRSGHDQQAPDALLPALRTLLTASTFGRPAESRWLGRVDSTNLIARDAARAGAPEGTLIVAEEQRAGRGRLGRRWQAPYGSSLLVSLLLRPPATVYPALLPFLTAVALAETMEQILAVQPALKWPNDVQVDGRKLAGILAESDYTGDQLDAVVVGVGLNVNIPRELLAPIAPPATSLLIELGRPVERVPLLAAFLARWENRYRALLRGESPVPAWRTRAPMLGAPIEVRPAEGSSWSGIALDVTDNGALLVRDAAGLVRTVHAADVSVRGTEPAPKFHEEDE